MENIVATLNEFIEDDYTNYNICITDVNNVNFAKFEIDMSAIKKCDIEDFYKKIVVGTNSRLIWHQQNSDAIIEFDNSIMMFGVCNYNHYMCNCEFKIKINQSVIDVFSRILEISKNYVNIDEA